MGKRRRKNNGALEFFEYVLVLALYGILNLLPHRVAVRIGAAAGALVYGNYRRHRGLVQEQLRMVFPQWSMTRVQQVARQCYANLGKSVAEFARLGWADRETVLSWVTIEGMEQLERARAQGRGVIFLTAHLGNWELLGVTLSLLGYQLHPVARPLDNPWANRLVNRIRSRHGSAVVSKHAESAPRDLIDALRRGDSVGVLLDQNAKPSDGVFVDFMGRPACTAKGLALIARRTGALVVPTFIIRKADDRHHIVFEPPVELARSRDVDADVLVNTARCTAAIERRVRACPEQWVWMHRRWKTRPEAAAGRGEENPFLHAAQPLS